MLSIRQKNILAFVVRDYVRNNRPVASVRVHKKNLTQTSAATIRNEMRALDQFGFLKQEHGSGGRAPTQKAYRYFVDHCIVSPQGSSGLPGRRSFNRRMFGEKIFPAVGTVLAKELSLFSAVGIFGKERRISSCGAEHFFTLPELQSFAVLNDFGYVLDHIEDVLWEYRNKDGEGQTAGFSVFIGGENPVSQMRSFSVFRFAGKNRYRENVVSFSLGPIRMDYERADAIITTLIQ